MVNLLFGIRVSFDHHRPVLTMLITLKYREISTKILINDWNIGTSIFLSYISRLIETQYQYLDYILPKYCHILILIMILNITTYCCFEKRNLICHEEFCCNGRNSQVSAGLNLYKNKKESKKEKNNVLFLRNLSMNLGLI